MIEDIANLRAHTEEEVRRNFLDHIHGISRYWADVDMKANPDGGSIRERLNGMVHSILATLDGCSGLPGFLVVPAPHPDDADYHKANGDNWYPPLPELPDLVDISGNLHEEWGRMTAGRQWRGNQESE